MFLSNDNSVSRNICRLNSDYGIHLEYCSNNIISGNNFGLNDYGIILDSSSGNAVYFNRFNNNTTGNVDSDSTNTWNSPTRLCYIYGGISYKSYLGNYYSEYEASETISASDVEYFIFLRDV